MRSVVVLSCLLVVFVGCCCGAPSPVLRDLANRHNKLIGSCAAQAHLSETNYSKILGTQFDVITPENEMKWSATEPNRNQFTYSAGDAIVNFANNHNQKVRGHNLCWGQYNPSWLENGNFNATSKKNILHNHITNVVNHWKGRLFVWDVVNEAVQDNPTPGNVYKHNVWYPDVPDYIDLAFQWANQADPSAKLFYNDYSAEASGTAKSDQVYEMVRSMKQRGIPIHGVGLQYHQNKKGNMFYLISLKYSPAVMNVINNIDRLTQLGLEVHITELDVSIQGGQGSESQILASQANVYGKHQNKFILTFCFDGNLYVMKVCLSNPKCTAFVMWGFTDKYTWLGSNMQPLIYDVNYNPKPAFNTLVSVLQGS